MSRERSRDWGWDNRPLTIPPAKVDVFDRAQALLAASSSTEDPDAAIMYLAQARAAVDAARIMFAELEDALLRRERELVERRQP